jgi:non-lysosomal glucosylceramidase
MTIRSFHQLFFSICCLFSLSVCFAEETSTNRVPLADLIPANKHLDPAWVKSLSERGEPEIFKGSDLKFIGMPVGGQFAGQLYLGGDGRLWNWDIFNDKVWTGADHYAHPMEPSKFLPLEQGFTLRIGEKSIPLDTNGFSEVSFRGEYPVGIVHYKDPSIPLTICLEAFSPFIPLDVEDSSLPATIMRFTIHNDSKSPVEGSLSGTLENAVDLRHRNAQGERSIRTITDHDFTFLDCSATGNPGELLPATNKTNAPSLRFEDLPDSGTMGLALLGNKADEASEPRTVPISQKLVGSLSRTLKLAPGESTTVTFVVTWFFPNLNTLPKLKEQGQWYAGKFDSALGVARYIAANSGRLIDDTLLWRDTWYDSTLPCWFLDRTFLNISIMATSTSHRLKNGRYWAWEGVGDCAGTCGHVYYYGQANGRLFPKIEREQREQVDFGPSQQTNGAIFFRGENNAIPAIDAQSGYILRALREHQVSATNDFLKRIWPRVKLATDWLIAKDGSDSGIIHGNQHNTLDKDWFGENAWLSGDYQASLLASAKMADLMNDPEYAARCRKIAEAGRNYMAKNLFNGEYYQNKVDSNRLKEVNSGSGCEIDQLMGQSWAYQVGLPRVFPKQETVKSLESLWKYNFAPDVGPYRRINKPGRWYAMPGESGLLMCTFPKSDWNYMKASGGATNGFQVMASGYFNECMNGFEHQVAGHMIWEGEPGSDLMTKGLAIERALHDRYSASKRNPYNEIECGDHYGRSMASYGVFLAACGFEYDGPKGHIGFAPKIRPEDFKAAFTAAEGWGSYSQKISDGSMTAELAVKWGSVSLRSFGLAAPSPHLSVTATCHGKTIPSTSETIDGKTIITFKDQSVIKSGESLKIDLNVSK